RDLAEMVNEARNTRLYTNLITSGVGLDDRRARELRDAGLDSAQISFQADDAEVGDAIAGAHVHEKKLEAMRAIRDSGIALSTNVVLHLANISRLPEIIAFAADQGAEGVEVANVQFYGCAFLNRAH